MNADLRTCTAIALLAMCGSALAEPVEPVSAHRGDTSVVQLAEPDSGAGLHEAAMADASGVRSAASAENAAPAAGERRAASGRRLTLRQKRLFVLGLAAQENK